LNLTVDVQAVDARLKAQLKEWQARQQVGPWLATLPVPQQ